MQLNYLNLEYFQLIDFQLKRVLLKQLTHSNQGYFHLTGYYSNKDAVN